MLCPYRDLFATYSLLSILYFYIFLHSSQSILNTILYISLFSSSSLFFFSSLSLLIFSTLLFISLFFYSNLSLIYLSLLFSSSSHLLVSMLGMGCSLWNTLTGRIDMNRLAAQTSEMNAHQWWILGTLDSALDQPTFGNGQPVSLGVPLEIQ